MENLNVAGCCCVYNDFIFLEDVVENILPFMKKIFFFVSYSMYDGNSKENDNVDTLKIIDKLKEKHHDQIVLIRKDWKNQIIQRNEALKIIQEAGYSYTFIFDADEFYSNDDLSNLFHHGIWFSHMDAFNTHFHTYFKKVNYRIEPLQRLKALSLIKSHVRLNQTRGIDSSVYSTFMVPQKQVCWHHLSHVRNDEQMLEKFIIAKHEYGLDMNWYYKTWLNWTPDIRNFHPNDPTSFSRVVKLRKEELPKFLQKYYEKS